MTGLSTASVVPLEGACQLVEVSGVSRKGTGASSNLNMGSILDRDYLNPVFLKILGGCSLKNNYYFVTAFALYNNTLRGCRSLEVGAGGLLPGGP